MLDIFVFGHYFGFASTANYATSLYEPANEVINSVIGRFNFNILCEDKIQFEQRHESYRTILTDIGPNLDPAEKLRLRELNIQGERQLVKAEKIEGRVKFFLTGDKLSFQFIDVYKKSIKPLFPLAGTFSVLILLMTCFFEMCKEAEGVLINMYLFLNILMCILIIYNIKGFKYSAPVFKRSVYMSSLMAVGSIVAFCFAMLMKSFPELALFETTTTGLWILLILSLLLSGAPVFVITYKVLVLYIYLAYYERNFRQANRALDLLLKNIQKRIGSTGPPPIPEG